MMRVSFVIPVRDDAQRLRVCLNSIARNDYPADLVEIVIVDNGSKDDVEQLARERNAIIVPMPRGGVSDLRNAGAAAASGEVLAFVDADHEINDQWIGAAVSALASGDDVAAVGALCHAPDEANWVQKTYDRLRIKPAGRCEAVWLGSGNLAIRRTAFDSVSGFDISLESCEDVDLCNRIRRAGFRILSDSALRNVHFGDPSTLPALFWGELWRGRGNLRATMRGPRTMRHWRSLLVPVVDVLALASTVVALLFVPVVVALLPLLIVAAFALIRTAMMLRGVEWRGPRLPTECFAVALVFDVARALALIARTPHHARRIGEHVPANSHS